MCHVAEVCSDAPSERDYPSTHESGQQLLACDHVNMLCKLPFETFIVDLVM